MKQFTLLVNGVEWHYTPRMRFVIRDDKRILQQCFYREDLTQSPSAIYMWRDIPLLEESEA